MSRETLTRRIATSLTGLILLAGGSVPALAHGGHGGLDLEDVGEIPGHTATSELTQADVEALIATGDSDDLDALRTMGLLVFSTPFNSYDGLGDGPWDPSETDTRAFGHRPTLQGNGTFLRVNGLDAQACNECHTIVKNSTLPPTLGIAGVGSVAQNAMPAGSLIDVADSADDRVSFIAGHTPNLPLTFDGTADYNGRFINPPFLYGGGGVELVGKEMTANLQWLLDQAQAAPAGTVIALDTHGVHFGYVTSLGGGDVELDPEGIGPVDYESVAPEEVLVVRPFGRKGENFSMRDFDRGAMQFHFGIQPVEVFGSDDEDGDGLANEVSIGEMSALHIFDVTNPKPIQEYRNFNERKGFDTFQDIGCSSCHIPSLETSTPFLPLATPEVAHDPDENVYAYIDLEEVGFDDNNQGGISVPLFADLKRHDMGPDLAESCEACTEISNSEFTTARLWGIADTAPYLHDGRATTLFQAIEMHGGEAQYARDAFLALSETKQARLLAFLRTLRTPYEPNEDVLP